MMSATPAETVIDKLTAEGYERQPTPFKIANVTFDFTAALLGAHGRSLDLVLVVDTRSTIRASASASALRR